MFAKYCLLVPVNLCWFVRVPLGKMDMDVAATLASLSNARSSVIMSDRQQKLLKIRYNNVLCKFCTCCALCPEKNWSTALLNLNYNIVAEQL